VIGPGIIGLELGQALHRLGVHVVVLGRGGRVGPLGDPEIVAYATATFRAEFTLEADAKITDMQLDGDRVAIRVEDDRIEIARLHKNTLRSYCAEWDFENAEMPSDWMDSSHVGWFSSLFDQFKNAIERKAFVGIEAVESFRCVQLIQMGYRSANEDSRRITLSKSAALSLSNSDGLPLRQIAGASTVAP